MKRITLSLVLFILGLTSVHAKKESMLLDKNDYGAEWIFLADEVSLNCFNGNVIIYNYDDDKEYPLTEIDAQTRKVLFIEDSATPILKNDANVENVIKEGKALCKGETTVALPDISDERITLLAENRIIMQLNDPLSFKAISHEVKRDDDNIFVTVNYQANDNGTVINRVVTAVFDYWANFVEFRW